MLQLKGRVAVITGAGSGIGRALAHAFAEQGASLVLADLDASDLEETRAELPREASVRLVLADVSLPDAVETLAEQAFADGEDVAVLCNNAGVGCNGLAWEQSLEDWEWLLGVNLMGVVHGIRSFVPRLLAQGTPAHVVNTSSMMGLLAAPGLGAYSATKHAVVAISEALRMDLASQGAEIGVSVLCPGPVNTRVFEERGRPAAPAGRREEAGTGQGAQRAQLEALLKTAMSPREVADCVVEALCEKRFYVFPAPDYVAGIEIRNQEVRQQVESLSRKVDA